MPGRKHLKQSFNNINRYAATAWVSLCHYLSNGCSLKIPRSAESVKRRNASDRSADSCIRSLHPEISPWPPQRWTHSESLICKATGMLFQKKPTQTNRLVPAELPGRGDEGGAYAATQTHVLQVFGEALGRKRSPWGFRKHIQGATKAHALECALCRITKRINAPANKSWSVVVLLLPWHPQLCEPVISHSAKSEPSRPTTLNRGGKAWPNHLLCSWACCKQSKNSCVLHL